MSWAELFSSGLIDSLKWFGETSTPQEGDTYLGWLTKHHSRILTSGMSDRHLRLWAWFDVLDAGVKPAPRVECWPRGGAKSTTAELGVAYIGTKGSRNYCLYVSETQDQADKHVAAISSLFEQAGVNRALTKYGHSKGWRRNQLRTATGFNVEALGLDTAARGIKIDEFRPDLIIFDDIDNREDHPVSTAKKERAIKDSIIPAGSSDCAVLFIQNKIIEDGIMAKLLDDRADFLLERDVPEEVPAVYDLEYEIVDRGDGRKIYKVTGGVASWEGQSLETCERQINEWGLTSFLRESQHEVAGTDGLFFDVKQINIIPTEELPELRKIGRGWDWAATEGGGDFTAGALGGMDSVERLFIFGLLHEQWGSDKVRKAVFNLADEDKEKYGPGVVCIPQDPGQAGKAQAVDMGMELRNRGHKVLVCPPHGKKALRARDLQDICNSGNMYIVEGPWVKPIKEEMRQFIEDEKHEHDDIVDALCDLLRGMKVTRIGFASA